MKLTKAAKSALFIAFVFIVGWVCSWYISVELRPTFYCFMFIATGLILLYLYLNRDNDFQKNMLVALGISVTIVSWFVNGYINNKNEIERNKIATETSILNQKRELKTRFLLDAYLRLENYQFRDNETKADAFIYGKYLESALTSIQLLGDSETVRLAHKFIITGGTDFNKDLLIQLRTELRRELEISPLPVNDSNFIPSTFRIYSKTPMAIDTLTSQDRINLTIKLNELNRDLIK